MFAVLREPELIVSRHCSARAGVVWSGTGNLSANAQTADDS